MPLRFDASAGARGRLSGAAAFIQQLAFRYVLEIQVRLPSSSGRRPVGANMTPMIDVVFLLIIFFLVSSHLSRQENSLPLDLPIADSSGTADADASSLTISVDANSNWFVGGRRVDLDEIRDVFSDHARRDGADAKLRLRTDRDAEYQAVEPLLREAAKAGLSDASISVRKEEGT